MTVVDHDELEGGVVAEVLPRRGGRGNLLVGVALVIVGTLYVFWLTGATWIGGSLYSSETLLSSCINHSTFVRRALHSHLETHGTLPFVAGLPGEELFCRIDFNGYLAVMETNLNYFPQNCHAGAPGQGHGGWQMVNASADAWAELLAAPRDAPLPVLWCGRAHTRAGFETRVVIFIPERVSRLAELGMRQGGGAQFEIDTMREVELAAAVAAMNIVLARHSLPPTALDVEGRDSYEDLALPHQSQR